MDDKRSSPFSGLDKALLRSTQPRQPAPEIEHEETPEPPPLAPKRRASAPKERQPDSEPASMSASSNASTLASNQDNIVAEIRKIVKFPGREVSYVRLTPEEKGQLADIVYTYKRQGKRTSETEINRIAVNYILQDYKANGANSIIARVIEALLA